MKLMSLCIKHKPVILLMDRIDAAGDNSEAMYHYLKDKKDVDVFFILKKGCKDWNRLQPDSHIVNFNSIKYYWLYSHVDIFFTAYSLFHPKGSGLYKNKNCKIIWLQHGITIDDMSKVYNALCHHDIVVATTKPEYEGFLSPKYGYNSSQLILTGMPRYDLIENKSLRVITICLTWRQYIKNIDTDDFFKTDYFSIWEDLIISPELSDLVTKYGYKLQFLFHYEINQKLRELLMEKKLSSVSLVTDKMYKDIISESDLLITDYSSVAFDMAYLYKPVVFYQKDKDTFLSGNHTHRKGYFDYEKDGLGELIIDKENLLNTIEQYLQNDCKMKEVYLERVNKTFVYHDKNNRERIWKEIENRFLK